MKISTKNLFFAIVLGAALLPSTQSYGIPAFARRYQMDCTMCHEPVPRLNEFGYKFRAAGFRLPEEIGKGESSRDYSDYIAARVFFTGTYESVVGSSNNTDGVNTPAMTNIGFSDASIYPLCGAFGGNISAFTEFGYAPGGGINVGNAFMRFTFGDTTSFWSFRAGIFNGIEGYGASETDPGMSALGLTGPLFPAQSATTLIGGAMTSAPNAWGASETAIEAGWNMGELSLRAAIANGGFLSGGAFTGAVGGSVNKPAGSPSFNSKEYRFFGNYILDSHGGSIAGYYFTGSIDLPNPDSATNANFPAAAMFPDQYKRYGLFATSPTFSGFKVLAGVGMGTDNEWVSDTSLYKGHVADSTAASMGYFGELDYRIDKTWSVGGRYDYFNPITGSNYANNDMNSICAFVSFCPNNGLVVNAEVKKLTSVHGLDSTPAKAQMLANDYTAGVQAFFIW